MPDETEQFHVDPGAQDAPVPAAAVDVPGKEPEPAAASGAEPTVAAGMSPVGQGAQVILTGDAQAAARGGPHADIGANTAARDAAIVAGHVAPGTTAFAAMEATARTFVDELEAAETDAIAEIKAKFAAMRAQRAAKPPA